MKLPVTKPIRTIGLVLVFLTLLANFNIIANWPPLWVVAAILGFDAVFLICYSVVCFRHKCVAAGVGAIVVTLLIFGFYALLYFTKPA